MFEQSLYEQEPIAPPLQEGDLFSAYEIKSWSISARIYKIIGMSVVVNLLAVIIFAQGSLLTMKGCDSPLVGSFCQVFDTIYIGALLFGTDREYVDADYEKTDLGEAEITYIEVTPESARLSYPEGYFAVANPVQYQQLLDSQNNATGLEPGFLAPGIPSSNPIGMPPTSRPYIPGRSVLDTKPNPPKRNDDVIDGPLPGGFDDLGTGANTPIAKRRPGGKVVDRPGKPGEGIPGFQGTEQKPVDSGENSGKSDPVAGVELNKRPFVDLAKNVNKLLDKKEVKLESAFVVNASGKLTKDGKLDPKSFRWGQIASQDEKLIEVVKEAVEAINASGYLAYLKDLSGKDFNMMLQQDDMKISAVVQSEMESETRANSIRSTLTILMDIARSKKSSADADQNDKDDLILLQNSTVETDGKKVVIKFNVPKDIALPMIQRKLAEQKAAPPQSLGDAIAKPNNNTAEK